MSREHFLQAIAAAGIELATEPRLVDGELERVRDRRDKAGSRNVWVVFYGHPVPAGAFGSWRTGESHTWRMKPPVGETRGQRAERRRQLEDMHRQRLQEQERVQASARARLASLIKAARPATDDHPYLKRKAAHAYGLLQLRDMLVIVARDASGTAHTAQFISPDGTKRFLTGGRIAGCYFSIGRPARCIFLVEGYCTGASVFEATGAGVAVCFSAGNLKPVALALRAKFPELRLVIAADNDAATPGNPGVTHAIEAAAAAGAVVAVPDFSGVQA